MRQRPIRESFRPRRKKLAIIVSMPPPRGKWSLGSSLAIVQVELQRIRLSIVRLIGEPAFSRMIDQAVLISPQILIRASNLKRITTDPCLHVGIAVELANRMKGFNMARKRSFTSQLYSLARLSNNLSAASKGPGSYAKRMVRRKVYGKQMRFTRAILKGLGLSK